MSAYLAGVTGAPLTSAVIAMELTNNREMVIPIMAVCLLARAASSVLSPTPVYKDFAERLMRDFEQQQEEQTAAASSQNAGPTTAFGEPVALAGNKDEESDR
jgi:H+/Cl- antiporter ClcA